MTDILYILWPVIILTAGAALMFLVGLSRKPAIRDRLPYWAFLCILIAFIVSVSYLYGSSDSSVALKSSDGSLRLSPTSLMITYITLTIGALLVLISWNPDRFQDSGSVGRAMPANIDRSSIAGEYFALLMLSLAGMLLTAVANNLIILFLALELVSIPTYIMVALSRPRMQAKEAGLKYFYLGALAAALMVYGFSFLYGITGKLQLDKIGTALAGGNNSLILIVLLLVVVGLCFKIAAVPMHFYAADVYQGAASPVTALLAFVPKFAGFYALFLIISQVCGPFIQVSKISGEIISWLFWIIAAATMTTGNVLALMQKNVKRILAYSSIAHSGYILLAILAQPAAGSSVLGAILFYITVYAIATLGAFAVLTLLERNSDEAQQLSDLTGLARSKPALAAALAVCIFSLIGMPLTAGFIGKFYVFSTLVSSTVLPMKWLIVLLVIAVINAAVAAGYYLRIIAACYLDDGVSTVDVKTTPAQNGGIALAVLFTIILGVAPRLMTKLLQNVDWPTPTRSAAIDSSSANPTIAENTPVQPPAHLNDKGNL
jgi:NADH-quinone oxidoreductase subunit N